MSKWSAHNQREADDFNNFLNVIQVLDLPLLGRKFTWFRPNGQSMSRMDEVMVSPEWLDLWPNFHQMVLDISLSDHGPVILR